MKYDSRSWCHRKFAKKVKITGIGNYFPHPRWEGHTLQNLGTFFGVAYLQCKERYGSSSCLIIYMLSSLPFVSTTCLQQTIGQSWSAPYYYMYSSKMLVLCLNEKTFTSNCVTPRHANRDSMQMVGPHQRRFLRTYILRIIWCGVNKSGTSKPTHNDQLRSHKLQGNHEDSDDLCSHYF